MAKTVLNTSIFNADIDSHINTGTAAANEVLSYTGSDYDWVTQSGGVALTDFSVTTNSAGTAALSYSNSTGVFSYTPPDLSSYLTAETNDLTSAVTWANVPNANITESSVTQHQAALSITSTQVTDFGEAVDDQVNTLLQAGLGIDFTYDDANNELLIDSNHVEVYCTNNSGSSIPIGTPVYQTGVSGNNITIAPADADDSSKMPAIGMTTSTLADEAEGTIVVLGIVSGLNTSSFSAGDTVYVSTTAGGLTTTPPAGESGLIQNFGRVLKVNASSGSIAIMGAGRANAVSNLNDGNIFIGNSSNQAEARALVEADISDFGTYLTGITGENIGSLSDVTITSASNGQVLKYNGTAWVNSADSGIALTDLSITTASAGTAALSYNNSTGAFTFTPPDLSSYLTAETNDLTSAVTWANVPNANITESSVTQHQAALSITESQISDFGTYLTGITGENIGNLSDVTITSAAAGELLRYNGSAWVNSDPIAGRFSIVNSSSSAYVFTGFGTSSDSNPTLYLTRGQTYEFVVNASGHPFYIKTVSGTGTGNAYSDGVTNNGAETGTVTLAVQMDAPDTLYYNCSAHSAMAGTIYILDSTVDLSDFSVTTNSAGTAALSYSNGVFTFTPPDLSSYLTAETNDLTSAVTWANVPNANITESSVTQHQAALSITESQISDLQTYLTGITGQSIENLSDVTTMTPTDGQVLTWDNTNSYWYAASPSGGSYNDSSVDSHLNTSTAATNEVLSWNGSDYAWVSQSGGSGIALTDLSVTTNSAGTAALSYNNTTGVFSYTPPDLSSYLTGITGQSIENLSDVNSMSPTDGQVLTWDNTNSYWYAADASAGSYGDSSVDTHLNQSTAASNEILSWNGSDYEWIEQGIATVYSLTGTAIDPDNGGIQTKTISANTTFTETLASGESVVLMFEGAASYTITWPTITWVTSSGNSAPTLTAKDTLVLWKVSTTLYGAYVGSYA